MARSAYWGPALTDRQFAVFHFDVKTMSLRDAQGRYLSSENGAPSIFDSLESAESYCCEKITATPALGCRIYDGQGQTVHSFSNEAIYERHHGQPAARRSLWIGIACLFAGFGGIALDAWLGWRLTFGVLLGVRFLWAGTVKAIDGIVGLLETRTE